MTTKTNIIFLLPKYKYELFDSESSFRQWLKKTTYKELILSDLGQDMQKIWIAESGEILHCDFHAHIYNGQFVNVDTLSEFQPIEIFENGGWIRKMGLLVDEIRTPIKQ